MEKTLMVQRQDFSMSLASAEKGTIHHCLAVQPPNNPQGLQRLESALFRVDAGIKQLHRGSAVSAE